MPNNVCDPLGALVGDIVSVADNRLKVLFMVTRGVTTDYRLENEMTLRVIDNGDDPQVFLLSIYYDEDGHGGIEWRGSGEQIRKACMGLDGGNPDYFVVYGDDAAEKFRREPSLSSFGVCQIESFAYKSELNDEFLFVEFEPHTQYTRMFVGTPVEPEAIHVH